MEVKTIPESSFEQYRRDVIFSAYKWDLQESEQSTISSKAALLEVSEASLLSKTAVSLYHETVAMETVLKDRPDLAVFLGISKPMATALKKCVYNPDNHIRLMRFDFHFTALGWVVSEVNSDAIAGYPEASVLPLLAGEFFPGCMRYGNFAEVFAERLKSHLPDGGTVAYLHDTRIVDDYQILRFLGDFLEYEGFKSIYSAPGGIKWANSKAANADAIIRCFPVDYLEYEKGADWRSFLNCTIPSCNHPTALLTQSKRLPLVWDKLDVDIATWRSLLPETVSAKHAARSSEFILKPAFGRTGIGINIPGTVSPAENKAITLAAKRAPNQWVAQRMFKSIPINGLHLCIGAFVIDGKFAGFYGRASRHPKIDSDSSDIPVLVNTVQSHSKGD